ncbi:hypothetical protein NP233_g7322 [Leucocoprinus birnbaumii]|uniref:Uncharacterized protein n=1 Tax=Leucocoprinus birnbaumii TaxID=56174 RepID=A0AAD5VRN2_9AGAR|nr:hypothetical protein NP233_g7322 [Leucocoprinus birnbaumii]
MKVPDYVSQFAKQFPSTARLCQIQNAESNLYLDTVQLSRNSQDANDYVVCRAPNQAKVKYWLILPYGNGQALVPVVQSQEVQYLTPSRLSDGGEPMSLSRFPIAWQLLPAVASRTQVKSSNNTFACLITWVGDKDREVLLASNDRDTSALMMKWEDKVYEYWYIHFVPDENGRVPPVIPGSGVPNTMTYDMRVPNYVADFCRQFPPSARLCQIKNTRHTSNTLYLDVHPQGSYGNDYIVANTDGNSKTKYWIILPYGNGQALVPVDQSQEVRYLTPSPGTANADVPVSLSRFPISWELLPPVLTYGLPELNVSDRDHPGADWWQCLITCEACDGTEYKQVLRVWDPRTPRDGNVVVDRWERRPYQYWAIQFIKDAQGLIPAVIPDASGGTSTTSSKTKTFTATITPLSSSGFTSQNYDLTVKTSTGKTFQAVVKFEKEIPAFQNQGNLQGTYEGDFDGSNSFAGKVGNNTLIISGTNPALEIKGNIRGGPMDSTPVTGSVERTEVPT